MEYLCSKITPMLGYSYTLVKFTVYVALTILNFKQHQYIYIQIKLSSSHADLTHTIIALLCDLYILRSYFILGPNCFTLRYEPVFVLPGITIRWSPRSFLAVKLVTVLRGRSGRPMGSRGCYVHKERSVSTLCFSSRVLDKLDGMVFDAISEVVFLVVVSVCFSDTLIGDSVVVEFTTSVCVYVCVFVYTLTCVDLLAYKLV